MPGSIKVAGAFKDVSPYVKVGGSWKFAPEAWSKVSGSWKQWFLASGFNDSEFNIEDNYNGPSTTVNTVVIQPDGKILLGGAFTTFNSLAPSYFVRLNSDGTRDTTFTTNNGTGSNGVVNAIAVQSDGKILLGGTFTAFNNVSSTRIVRLNADGTVDTTFATNTGAGASFTVSAIAVQSDGKILVGGNFTTFNNVTVNFIVRLNADGTRDTGFVTNNGGGGLNSAVNTIAIQSDGKIVIGGGFTIINGTTVNFIARLNTDGTRDTTFTTNTGTGANLTVNTVAIQSDGKIVLGGGFSTFNGTTVNRIVRLNIDGTRDTTFTTNAGTGANDAVNAIAIQSDGKIMLVGVFTTFNSLSASRLIRLNADGTIDAPFRTNIDNGASSGIRTVAIQSDGNIILGGDLTSFTDIPVRFLARLASAGTLLDFTASGANLNVNTLALQSDGKLLLGGTFTRFNRQAAAYFVRLNPGGTVDTTFMTNVGTGANNAVNTIAVQSDGKILLGGTFTTFNGTTANRILRLNSDGTRDTTFTTNNGTAANNTVNRIAVQSDGKILVGGQFTTFNNVTSINRILRLNADGTRDTAFTVNVGSGANTPVLAIVPQSDGKIVLGGQFSTFNGVTVNSILRLNSDGTRDTAFTANTGTGANLQVNAVAVQSDGKIILVGQFSLFNGVLVDRIVRLNSDGTIFDFRAAGASGAVTSSAVQSDGKILLGGQFSNFNSTQSRIIRMNTDGTVDTTFVANTGTGPNSNVITIAVQSDGKILLGGFFTTFNSASVNYIVRLNSDGTRDTAFTANTGTGANNAVNAIAVQSNGSIIVSGQFTTFNGTTANRVLRLNSDGTRDTTFTTNNGTAANNTISTAAIQSDGKILLGGSFTAFNETTINRIVRLNTDGTRDTTFTTNTGTGANSTVNTIAIQSNGNILVGGGFSTFNNISSLRIISLNTDGTRDTGFINNTGTGANSSLSSLAVQSDGKILVGGQFTTFNGTTANRIIRLNADGTRDTAFTSNHGGSGSSNLVSTIAVMLDGKVVLGGFFNSFNNQIVNYIIRLNSSGSIFDYTSVGSSQNINDVSVQSDGKIVLGGLFTIFGSAAATRVVRLNADSTVDTAFTSNTGTGPSSDVNALVVQSDGKVVIGGAFTFFNSIVRNYIARLGGDLSI